MLNDKSPMPIGKFKGKKMEDVPAWHLDWLSDQEWCRTDYPDLYDYIIANLDAIEQELDEPDEEY